MIPVEYEKYKDPTYLAEFCESKTLSLKQWADNRGIQHIELAPNQVAKIVHKGKTFHPTEFYIKSVIQDFDLLSELTNSLERISYTVQTWHKTKEQEVSIYITFRQMEAIYSPSSDDSDESIIVFALVSLTALE